MCFRKRITQSKFDDSPNTSLLMFAPKSDALPPITFEVKDARLLSSFPNSRDELWVAQVKAVRKGLFSQIFKDILFVESDKTAYVYGIEEIDGCPRGLRHDLAARQKEFISFLRSQTSRNNAALGIFANLFSDHEFGCEGLLTATYVAARGVPFAIAIGYWPQKGGYERVRIDSADEWFEIARMTLPFNDLG